MFIEDLASILKSRLDFRVAFFPLPANQMIRNILPKNPKSQKKEKKKSWKHWIIYQVGKQNNMVYTSFNYNLNCFKKPQNQHSSKSGINENIRNYSNQV